MGFKSVVAQFVSFRIAKDKLDALRRSVEGQQPI